MGLIVTAEERLSAKQRTTVALIAPFGWGKTFQARTLDPKKTLFIDLEAGTSALDGSEEDGSDAWMGDIIKVRQSSAEIGVHPWEFARALVCLLCGADPAAAPGSPYSKDQYDEYEKGIAPASTFDKYDTVFIDSITVAARMGFAWSKRQPEAFSEKTGKPDTRGAYGLLGQEMITWLTQAQHIARMSVVMVGILNEKEDDFGKKVYSLQIDGGKTGMELPGIFDQIITGGMFDITGETPVMDNVKGTERGFICHQNNGYGAPAKDRSGRLNAIEPANLGAVLKKIQGGKRVDVPNFAMKTETETQAETQAATEGSE
jgi:hypothetical protein